LSCVLVNVNQQKNVAVSLTIRLKKELFCYGLNSSVDLTGKNRTVLFLLLSRDIGQQNTFSESHFMKGSSNWPKHPMNDFIRYILSYFYIQT